MDIPQISMQYSWITPKTGSIGDSNSAIFWIALHLFNFFKGFHGLQLFQNGWLRFPDIFQYSFDDFWNFKLFSKYGPSDPIFITEILKTYKKNMDTLYNKYYFCKSRNPHPPPCPQALLQWTDVEQPGGMLSCLKGLPPQIPAYTRVCPRIPAYTRTIFPTLFF